MFTANSLKKPKHFTPKSNLISKQATKLPYCLYVANDFGFVNADWIGVAEIDAKDLLANAVFKGKRLKVIGYG